MMPNRTRVIAMIVGIGAASLCAPSPSALGRSAGMAHDGGPTNRYGVAYLPLWHRERLWDNLRDLGVGWVRFDLWMGHPKHEEHFTSAIRRSLDDGYGLWLTIMHRDRSNVADQERYDRSRRGGFPAKDAEQYKTLLRRTVQPLIERLKSRGKEPGAWLVIQIENEVAPEDRAPTNPNRFWHGTSDQYLAHLGLSYQIVKSMDTSIPVAAAGIASEGLEWALNPGQSAQARTAAAWIDRMLREGRYDIADVHLYHAPESIPRKIAWVRERSKGLLAATEIGGPDERSGARYSEELHVKELSQRFRAVREAGLGWMFWLNLADAPTSDALGRTVGLTRADGGRKPAYEAYRALIAETRPVN